MKTSDIYTAYMYSYPHKMAYGELFDVKLSDYIKEGFRSGLYFHVPFCESKCGFCNLFSVTGKDSGYMADYISACEEQMRQYSVAFSQIPRNFSEISASGNSNAQGACCSMLGNCSAISAGDNRNAQSAFCYFTNVTIGGGDPLCLPPDLLHRLLSMCRDLEIYIEASPNSTTLEKISILKKFNIHRISLGVQSFIDNELSILKRTHSAESAKNALGLIQENDFPCVNIDLIYGIPTQTVESFEFSLHEALKFKPHEIFIYPLYVRSGTKIAESITNPQSYKQPQKIGSAWVSEIAYEVYKIAVELLSASGYSQTSMRRFVKQPSKNQQIFGGRPWVSDTAASGAVLTGKLTEKLTEKNCGFENMLAIGCGGRSYIGNLHFCHPYAIDKQKCSKIIDDFINTSNKTEIKHGYLLDTDEMKRRFVIKNLLHCQGLSLKEYADAFNGQGLSSEEHAGTFNTQGLSLEEHAGTFNRQGLSLEEHVGTFISLALSDFPILNDLVSLKYAVLDGFYVKLTPLGLSLSDYIGPMFVSDTIRRRVAAWT